MKEAGINVTTGGGMIEGRGGGDGVDVVEMVSTLTATTATTTRSTASCLIRSIVGIEEEKSTAAVGAAIPGVANNARGVAGERTTTRELEKRRRLE